MKKLESLNLARLSNLEYGQFIKSSCEGLRAMEGVTITDEIFTNYLDILETKSEGYNKTQIPIIKSDATAKIADADKKRDAVITATLRNLAVFELSENHNELEAFISLTNLFNNYKGIQSWNFEEETNGIDNLLDDLRTAKYNEHLGTLGMQAYIERIGNANNKFKSLFSDRTQEKAKKEIFDIKLMRQEINTVYSDMANYVCSLSKALNTEQYNRSLNLINTTRKYYSDLLARRNSNTITTN